jgi:hypothetical protein
MTLIEFCLTPEQEALVSPMVRSASSKRRNVLFLATAAPHKDTWRFRAVEVSPGTGNKILKLIQAKP